MIFQHLMNPAESHKWFAWRPVRVLRRTPMGPQFYTVWLSTVIRRAVVVQGSLQWVYDFHEPGAQPVKSS